MDTERLCREVAESLWAVYHERPDAPHLIWPARRDDSARVSEQESKILVAQWLERNGVCYSIETPTRQGYIQSGATAMSARIDVTVYGSRDPTDRVLNLELKSGTPNVEAFRKDFEKLLREGVPGLWLHTLTKARDATWRTLEGKLRLALDQVLEHAEMATHSIHFAFCVLERPALVEFNLNFSANWRTQLDQRFREAQRSPRRPSWALETVPTSTPAPQTAVRPHAGFQRKELIYAPSIESRSFIHLSARGDQYALRSFGGVQPESRWVDANCRTTTELLACHPIVHQVDVAGEGRNLSDHDYWAARISQLNREHGIE